jgi:hypothetical protein
MIQGLRIFEKYREHGMMREIRIDECSSRNCNSKAFLASFLHSVATHDKMYDLEDKKILELGTNRSQI